MAEVAAVVLAAGSGTRMGTRKQFLDLTPTERIVDRTIATCRACADWVGVVLPPGVPLGPGPTVDAEIAGGADRFASVAAGVSAVPAGADVVVVHSASHPLASVDLLRRTIEAVAGGADGVVPVLEVVDTVKRRAADGSLTTLGREGIGTAQGPMAYRRSVLARALGARGDFTDESVAVEAVGGRVVSVAGELTNLHVTDRHSLAVVRRLAPLVPVPGPSPQQPGPEA